jgi:hypothetical protein
MHNYQSDAQFRSAVDQQINSALYSERLRAADQANIARHHHGGGIGAGIAALFLGLAKFVLVVIAVILMLAQAAIQSCTGPHAEPKTAQQEAQDAQARAEWDKPAPAKPLIPLINTKDGWVPDPAFTPAPRATLVNPTS